MTSVTLVSRVTDILVRAGYRRLGTPLKIAGIEFDLPAALVGIDPLPDLILVIDTAIEGEQRTLKRIEGIARAMDVVGSKRPLTVVLTGPRPQPTYLDDLSHVCRVLPVGSGTDGDSDRKMMDWLAVLMPLDLRHRDTLIGDPLTEIADRLPHLPAVVTGLLELANQGAGAVERRLFELISEPLRNVDFEEEL